MITKKLIIELKSDLSVGSGFAYAGIIDSDVSYDKYGFPYISGRRLKGCIREAAELIGMSKNDIEKVFGKRAASIYDADAGLMIGDAYPVFKPSDSGLLEQLYSNDQAGQYFNQENIINLFTATKAQTRIGEDGVAQENTLRFTRVINQYSFADGNNIIFVAEISYKDAFEKEIEKMIKATRNIGLDRNRGLGSVKLKLESIDATNQLQIEDNSKSERVVIKYLIKNIAPLIISSEKDDVSCDYISGANAIGAFASKYLKMDGRSSEDKAFTDLFLTDRTVFSNLNLVVKQDGDYIVLHDAPNYINRLKKTKKLVDTPLLVKEKNLDENDPYYYQNGNQPKKLKGKKIAMHNGKYIVREVEKEIIYHHTKKNDEKLFFFEAIAPNQHFAGEIVVDREYKDIIIDILKQNQLSFGKSRTAQYGRCIVESVVVNDYRVPDYSFGDGQIVRINLLSDLVLIDDEGNYVTDSANVRKLIVGSIKAKDNSELNADLQVKIITGYSGVWNMHRQEIPAIAAGSTIEVETSSETKWPAYLGELANEGCGNYEVIRLGNTYKLEETTGNDVDFDWIKATKTDVLLNSMGVSILKDKMYKALESKTSNTKINITPASLGRLNLMAVESINEAITNGESSDAGEIAIKAMMNFADRVYSIKRVGTREECIKFLNNMLGKFPVLKENKETREFEMATEADIDVAAIVKHLTENIAIKDVFYEMVGNNEQADRMIFAMWNSLIIETLTLAKYSKKIGGR